MVFRPLTISKLKKQSFICMAFAFLISILCFSKLGSYWIHTNHQRNRTELFNFDGIGSVFSHCFCHRKDIFDFTKARDAISGGADITPT